MKPFDRSAHGRAHALKRKPWLAAAAAFNEDKRRRYKASVQSRRPRLAHGWRGMEGALSREAVRIALEILLHLDTA